jgi:low temperature requirement protein LtrA
VSTPESSRAPRLTAVMRDGERVTSLELFFDLVFVLALTQCTALMAGTPTWEGMLKGLLLLGVLWWSWGGYAWLTSVVDPEEGSVRLVMFAAMAALLVAALCVPRTFGEDALLFACAYGVVRAAHIALFMLASRDDEALRHSVVGLAGSTAIGVGLLVAAAFADGGLQLGLWGLALLLDMGGPFLFGADGWKLVPGHFADRHGAIVIIALGESIVAVGVGRDCGRGRGRGGGGGARHGRRCGAVVDVLRRRRDRRRTAPDGLKEGREQNEIARDSYSYLHFPMVAGIALMAVGLKRTLGHVGDPLGLIPATAMLGGAAMYLLAHVAFRWRNVHTLNRQRLLSVGLLGLMLLGEVELKPPSLATLGALAALLALLIAYEATHFAQARDRIRHQLARGSVPD